MYMYIDLCGKGQRKEKREKKRERHMGRPRWALAARCQGLAIAWLGRSVKADRA
jgi:hypothetical protein